jgi:hypothetical protein
MVMRVEILTFAGVLAVAFCTAFCLPKAVQMNKERRHLREYLWYLTGLIPIGIVCIGWAHTGDQFLVVQRSLLFLVGALIGGVALLAMGEWIRPTNPAAAQTDPGETKMAQDQSGKSPINITGGTNVFSLGQMGGQTAHTIINQASPPRTISDTAAQKLVEGLRPPAGKKPKITVDCANDGNATQYADRWEAILRAAEWDVTTGAAIISAPPLVGIRIAVRSADTLGAAQLQQAFSLLGEQASGELDPNLPPGEIRLKIGAAQ